MTAIETFRLSFAYPGGNAALRDITIRITEGERVGLVGPNGAGKSTLLLHLNGLLPEKPAAHPAVKVFDRPVGAEMMSRIRREVGLLFQNPDDQLFCPTVFEDVAFGPRQWSDRGAPIENIVAEALRKVGLSGYEQRSAHRLSHGEKRRVCIAGLLACDPRVLLLDEPTSDLDPRGRRELKSLLRGLDVTLVIASHDLELIAEICGRVLVLDEGRLVAEGRTPDILTDQNLMLAHGLETPRGLALQEPAREEEPAGGPGISQAGGPPPHRSSGGLILRKET